MVARWSSIHGRSCHLLWCGYGGVVHVHGCPFLTIQHETLWSLIVGGGGSVAGSHRLGSGSRVRHAVWPLGELLIGVHLLVGVTVGRSPTTSIHHLYA